ncbi:unnamed protein product [Ranitomeya imitator]|uniref:Macroglobulin domain-containing protein n=1 Tax=Ranitomeya imitator TaxID=111125 RepID=A0ABN9MBG3_9NEOB|nr:unnamed protein product [Ranitomeya imitator]
MMHASQNAAFLRAFCRVFRCVVRRVTNAAAHNASLNNPDGIVVLKNQFSSNEKSVIVQKSFTLPDIANEGIWKIAGKFQETPQEVFQTEFEVKEYVLPSFEVFLETPQNYYFVDDDHFTVDITARFLHGKPVEGSMYALFGVIQNNEKKSFPHSMANITVRRVFKMTSPIEPEGLTRVTYYICPFVYDTPSTFHSTQSLSDWHSQFWMVGE